MPLVDMPLDELKKYCGRNPRPADFDEYWDLALAELDATDPAPELIPATFQVPEAECFDLFYTGVRGARIHAKYLRPRKSSAPHPAIVEFHGYTGNCGDWWSKLAWVSQGFSIASMDARGQGGLSEDTGVVKGNTHHGHIIRGLDDDPDNMLFRQIFLDTAQLARVVMAMPEVDEARVGAQGMSQGGALTLACASLEPRINRLAPVCPFLCDYKRVWEMDLATVAYEEIKTYFRLFDPQHVREDEVFTRLGYIDCQYLAPRIRGEVLWGAGLMDTICPPSTQFAAYNRITAKKEVRIYPDFTHELYPGFIDDAFRFMMEMQVT